MNDSFHGAGGQGVLGKGRSLVLVTCFMASNLVQLNPSPKDKSWIVKAWESKNLGIAVTTLLLILAHLYVRYGTASPSPNWVHVPLYMSLVMGGIPLVGELIYKLLKREFGSDLLAGISIVTSVLLGEYLAGCLVVLMLSGGEALEAYAVRSASSVLNALAKRMPSIAHRRINSGSTEDITLDKIAIGDRLIVHPHEICPVDGNVVEGHGSMDESYLTGEPYQMSKTPGSTVISGAINGESALEIEATRLAVDSRYAKIMKVMQESEQKRPHLRRLGDQLGAVYTPLALVVALAAWAMSGDAVRFLAVLVVATPCPLLIAIPVAIIGSISLSARRGIVIKNPAVLEQIGQCRTMIFDKTGTLTYGKPILTEQVQVEGSDPKLTLRQLASLEKYSKHPLAVAVLEAAKDQNLTLAEATRISEPPGEGLYGEVEGHVIEVISRKRLNTRKPPHYENVANPSPGLECIVLVDGAYIATFRFRDEPRKEGHSFITHLSPKHRVEKIMIVTGDRESEALHLAGRVGITHVHAAKSPEEKLAIVRHETAQAKTAYMGDGVNDSPALTAATVGIAFGGHSDITAEAADAVIMEGSLGKVDEFLHIGSRMRSIAMQSAVGGIALSLLGMTFAAFGLLPPVSGALFQEIIDVIAVLNALRAAMPPKALTDFQH